MSCDRLYSQERATMHLYGASLISFRTGSHDLKSRWPGSSKVARVRGANRQLSALFRFRPRQVRVRSPRRRGELCEIPKNSQSSAKDIRDSCAGDLTAKVIRARNRSTVGEKNGAEGGT